MILDARSCRTAEANVLGSVNYVYNVPHKFGPNALLGDWAVAGTVYARSGLPFTVVDSNAYSI